MRRLVFPVLFILFLSTGGVGLLPSQVAAWGSDGHRIVARIAAAYLNPRARAAAASLLRDDPYVAACTIHEHTRVKGVADILACVATWADAVRNMPAYQATKPFHFVNIPLEAPGFDAARDCPKEKGCVVSALDQYQASLADRTRPRSDRAEALKFIIHLVGDVHQPLHDAIDQDRDATNPENAGKNLPATGEGDRGGNTKIVTWFGQDADQFGCWNLHAVWDAGMIERRRQSDATYAETLTSTVTSAMRARLGRGTVVDWVNEAFRLAVQHGYRLPSPEPGDRVCEVRASHGQECAPFDAETCRLTEVHYRYHLGQPYFDANVGVVDAQLTAAGIRLARILNAILK